MVQSSQPGSERGRQSGGGPGELPVVAPDRALQEIDELLMVHDWAAAAPRLQELAERALEAGRAAWAIEVLTRAGLCAERLERRDDALRHYRAARELDPTHLPTLQALGRLLVEQGGDGTALGVLQAILVHHGGTLGDAERADVLCRIGAVRTRMGDSQRGSASFMKAIELAPGHSGSLEQLVDLHRREASWPQFIKRARELVATLPEHAPRRVGLLVEVGDVLRREEDDADAAIVAYEEALVADPESVRALERLLEVLREDQRWEPGADVAERLGALLPDRRAGAALLFEAAEICRDRLDDAPRAVELFNRALDANPRLLRAFEAIDRIWTERAAWEPQEEDYRRMIGRVAQAKPPNPRLLAVLWRNLGEIYATRLARPKDAAMAYATASRLQPEDLALRESLAELYVDHIEDAADRAIAEHRAILERNPFRFRSYKVLATLFLEQDLLDRAWCMVAILDACGQASPEEEVLHRRLRPTVVPRIEAPLSAAHWRLLAHPGRNPYLGSIFSLLAAFDPLKGKTLKDWGLRRKDEHDLTQPLLFNRIFASAAAALGLGEGAPRVYLRAEGHRGIVNGNTVPWSLIVGRDVLQGRSDRELAFLLARRLSLFLPEHYLAGLHSIEHLRVVFLAAWKATAPAQPIPAPIREEDFAALVRTLQETIPPPLQADLRARIGAVLSLGTDLDLTPWVDGVEATASRVGLLLSGDLEQAFRDIRYGKGAIGERGEEQRVEDLLRFAASEEYLGLREALGLGVE